MTKKRKKKHKKVDKKVLKVGVSLIFAIVLLAFLYVVVPERGVGLGAFGGPVNPCGGQDDTHVCMNADEDGGVDVEVVLFSKGINACAEIGKNCVDIEGSQHNLGPFRAQKWRSVGDSLKCDSEFNNFPQRSDLFFRAVCESFRDLSPPGSTISIDDTPTRYVTVDDSMEDFASRFRPNGGLFTGPNGCLFPPYSLAHWWTGDLTFRDRVGEAHGKGEGDTFFDDGISEQAFKFDGTGDYVNVGLSDFASPEGTIILWAKNDDDVADSARPLFSRGMRGERVNGELSLGIIGTNSKIRFSLVGEGQRSSVDADEVVDLQWHHYAGVWVSNEIRFYKEAIEQGTIEAPALVSSAEGLNFLIGQGYGPDKSVYIPSSWYGSIDEVMLFTRALTEREIQQIHSARGNLCKLDCSTEKVEGSWYCDGNENWYVCGEDAVKGDIVAEGKYACDGTRWVECNKEGEVVGNAFCMNS